MSPQLETLSEPIVRSTLKELVMERVRGAIMRGELAPGSRVPEVPLAATFGVSRGPVREALISLAQEGMVEASSSGGFLVRSVTWDELIELSQIRLALEKLAVQLVVQRADSSELSPLRDIVDQMARIERGVETSATPAPAAALVELDTKFHLTLCELSGNDRLLQAWSSMRNEILLAIRDSAPIDRQPQYARHHRAVLTALESGSVVAAEASITEHIERFFAVAR